MVDPHRHPTPVEPQIIHAAGNSLPLAWIDEIVNAYLVRIASGTPLSPAIFEVPDQLLLLRVHRDGRQSVERREVRFVLNRKWFDRIGLVSLQEFSPAALTP